MRKADFPNTAQAVSPFIVMFLDHNTLVLDDIKASKRLYGAKLNSYLRQEDRYLETFITGQRCHDARHAFHILRNRDVFIERNFPDRQRGENSRLRDSARIFSMRLLESNASELIQLGQHFHGKYFV